jgi:hypothetical protein
MTQRTLRHLAKFVVPGFLLLQAAGCNFTAFNEALQTVLLGITAAGSVAILQNI